MMLIYLNQYNRSLLFLLIIMVATHDTASYIVGKLLGNHKITTISPGKSWEGFFGGYITTCFVTYFTFRWYQAAPHIFFIGWFSFVICIVALLGDLFESWLKRRAGVKDSGSLLPGHGGILDRFDGILFAVWVIFAMRDYLTILPTDKL